MKNTKPRMWRARLRGSEPEIEPEDEMDINRRTVTRQRSISSSNRKRDEDEMRNDFDHLPRSFRDRDFSDLRPADFAELLVLMEADLRPRSLGVSNVFTCGLGVTYIFNLALFRGERGSVVLHVLNVGDDVLAIKLCATGMREDILDFGVVERTITLHDFNRVGLPIAAYVPVVELLAARERLRGASEKGTARGAPAGM